MSSQTAHAVVSKRSDPSLHMTDALTPRHNVVPTISTRAVTPRDPVRSSPSSPRDNSPSTPQLERRLARSPSLSLRDKSALMMPSVRQNSTPTLSSPSLLQGPSSPVPPIASISPTVTTPTLVRVTKIAPARKVNPLSETKQSRRPSLSAPSSDELKKIRALKRVASKERKLQLKKLQEDDESVDTVGQSGTPVTHSLPLDYDTISTASPVREIDSLATHPNSPISLNVGRSIAASPVRVKVSLNTKTGLHLDPVVPSSGLKALDERFSTLSLDDLEDLGTLGKGCFGRVKLVRHRINRKLYALKILNKRHQIEQQQVQHAVNENNILQMIDHPFIVKHYGSFQDPVNLYILMERVVGAEFYDLLQEVRRFTEDQARFFSAQIVLILENLHNVHKVVYRDLKPENILLDSDGYLKLTDFGFAKIEANSTFTFCGTPCYIAPEVIYQAGYTNAVDWWSFGVMIYEMLRGSVSSTDPQNTHSKLLSSQIAESLLLTMMIYFSSMMTS